ncbi:MAG: Na+/H+ antiporter [Dysgonamonadaceae bacterium]|jgi:CPA1 family monovalent cation:H+ antiporter|nr:Na+/H+ antiporter [Dysgonamonadaceae bacterium]
MEFYTIVIILLAIAIGLSPVASKMRLPYPVVLLLAGIGVGFIPGIHPVSINPEVVFLLFLPPMLYDAAYNISFKEFKRNLPVISLLAFTLVFVTTGVIAVAVHYFLGLSWALSFVLGAILSPPDAIAATNVTKGLGLPHRTLTVLEGESLINDASALVAFRFAVAAVAGSAFVPLNAILMFLIALGGGYLFGWLLAHVFLFIAKKRLDKNVIVSLNLMLPFVAYLLAEEIHVSGVIAVVAIGLCIARHKDQLPEPTVTQSKSVLDTVIFILGGLVFILIGLQFPQVLKSISPDRFLPLIACSFLIFAVALLIRMATIFWHKMRMKNQYHTLISRVQTMNVQHIERMNRRFPNQKAFDDRMENFKSLLLTGKEAIIIGWSGMRGIVSLAAALSLPLLMTDGNRFPERDTIIFLTVSVVIIMLVVQGLGLPVLIKILKKFR